MKTNENLEEKRKIKREIKANASKINALAVKIEKALKENKQKKS